MQKQSILNLFHTGPNDESYFPSIKEFHNDLPKEALPKGKDSLVLFVSGTQFQYKILH